MRRGNEGWSRHQHRTSFWHEQGEREALVATPALVCGCPEALVGLGCLGGMLADGR